MMYAKGMMSMDEWGPGPKGKWGPGPKGPGPKGKGSAYSKGPGPKGKGSIYAGGWDDMADASGRDDTATAPQPRGPKKIVPRPSVAPQRLGKRGRAEPEDEFSELFDELTSW